MSKERNSCARPLVKFIRKHIQNLPYLEKERDNPESTLRRTAKKIEDLYPVVNKFTQKVSPTGTYLKTKLITSPDALRRITRYIAKEEKEKKVHLLPSTQTIMTMGLFIGMIFWEKGDSTIKKKNTDRSYNTKEEAIDVARKHTEHFRNMGNPDIIFFPLEYDDGTFGTMTKGRLEEEGIEVHTESEFFKKAKELGYDPFENY